MVFPSLLQTLFRAEETGGRNGEKEMVMWIVQDSCNKNIHNIDITILTDSWSTLFTRRTVCCYCCCCFIVCVLSQTFKLKIGFDG